MKESTADAEMRRSEVDEVSSMRMSVSAYIF